MRKIRAHQNFPDHLPRFLGATIVKKKFQKRDKKRIDDLTFGVCAAENFIKGWLNWFNFYILSDEPGFRKKKGASRFGNVMSCVRRNGDRKRMNVMVIPWINDDGSYPRLSPNFIHSGPEHVDYFVIAEIEGNPSAPEFYIIPKEQVEIFNALSLYLYKTGRRKETVWGMLQGFKENWGFLREPYNDGKPGKLELSGESR